MAPKLVLDGKKVQPRVGGQMEEEEEAEMPIAPPKTYWFRPHPPATTPAL